ncbi:MAG TPA: YceI family protein [Candidatus Angelobacter sp.]
MLLKVLVTGMLLVLQAGSPNQQKSNVIIHVYKGGMFSGFAHNHIIIANIDKQTVDPQKMSVEISIHSKELKVTDPEASESTRAEVQTAMLGPKVLDVDKYPEIHFKSSRIEQISAGRYRVTGMLDLHGTTREISFEVSRAPEHYHGSAKLKQTDYGIQPVSSGGGTVKVKDQIDIDFDVYP